MLTSLLTGFFASYLAVSSSVRWGVLIGLLLLNNWTIYWVLAHWDEFLHSLTSKYQTFLFLILSESINIVCNDATHLTGPLFWLWLCGEILSSIVVAWVLTKVLAWGYHRIRQVLKPKL